MKQIKFDMGPFDRRAAPPHRIVSEHSLRNRFDLEESWPKA
jgi:hypothetical protein